MTVALVAIKLFQQLFKRTSRQSKTFDKYQQSFLKKLQNSHSKEETEALFNKCIEQLCEHVTPIDNTLSEGRLIVSQSQLQLKKLNNLSALIYQKISDSSSIPQPYSVLEHHNELTDIIRIYQRVVIELNKSNVTTNIDEDPPLIDNICDELQQVILDLDVSEEYSKQLESIREKISAEKNSALLPQYCLQIITIVIDSTREERRSSRHFLYTLNDNLSQFYLSFSKNLKCAEATFTTQENCVTSIQKQSTALKKSTQEADDLSGLKENIFNYIETVEKIIENREARQEQQVRQQFQAMVRQIKELQNETNSYQKSLHQQSKKLYIDFLTKIPNRVAWSERLDIEFNRFQRYEHNLNIAVIDIDKFKMINDTFGHLAGDKVLNVIAQTLQKTIRNTDFIARYGGEEFAMLLPEISPQQAKIALEKLCIAIEKIPFKFKQESINITISIGCTLFCAGDDIDSAFERADKALYKAKASGRNQVISFKKK